jgi:CRP-like cAMP-binding protein
MSVSVQLVEVFEEIKEKYPFAITERSFVAKSDILLEDNDDNDVFLIREGKAAVIIGGGASEIVLGSGDLIGELSFLLGNRRSASIVAKEDVVCWSMTTTDMENVFSQDSNLSAMFYKSLGTVIAERLVNGSRRQMQKLIFQEEEDALIGLMSVQANEIKQKLDNFCRIIYKAIADETSEYREQLRSINEQYSIKCTAETWLIRKEKVAKVIEGLQEVEKRLFKKFEERLREVFSDLNRLLNELLDLEKRNEVGIFANHLFDETILHQVDLWRKRKEGGDSQTEPLLLIAHLLQNMHESNTIWDSEQLVAEWIDKILCEMPTVLAFRSRIHLLSKEMVGTFQTPGGNMTIVNDSAGVILARVYPTVAKVSGNICAVSHDATSLYYMDLGMDIRSGRVQMRFHRISSIISLVLGDAAILPPQIPLHSQDIIAIDGLMDYLPDRYLVILVEKCLPYLAPSGILLLSSILPTSDEALFSNFFQWHMVRRSEAELKEIFKILGLNVTSTIENNAIVIKAQAL